MTHGKKVAEPRSAVESRAPLAKSEVLARINLAKQLLKLSADQCRQSLLNQQLAATGLVELLVELEEGGAL
jgi:hypothetical protein